MTVCIRILWTNNSSQWSLFYFDATHKFSGHAAQRAPVVVSARLLVWAAAMLNTAREKAQSNLSESGSGGTCARWRSPFFESEKEQSGSRLKNAAVTSGRSAKIIVARLGGGAAGMMAAMTAGLAGTAGAAMLWWKDGGFGQKSQIPGGKKAVPQETAESWGLSAIGPSRCEFLHCASRTGDLLLQVLLSNHEKSSHLSPKDASDPRPSQTDFHRLLCQAPGFLGSFGSRGTT